MKEAVITAYYNASNNIRGAAIVLGITPSEVAHYLVLAGIIRKRREAAPFKDLLLEKLKKVHGS